MKIFWSWQSDTPGKIGRHFVRDALDAAVAQLQATADLVEPSERDVLEAIHVDQDRQDVSGSRDLAAEIRKKIANCDVFVADVTSVGIVDPEIAKLTAPKSETDREPPEQPKRFINSNVGIELGYGYESVGDDCVLLVMNDYFGKHQEMPFDLRHKGGTITYRLAPDADVAERTRVRKQLANRLAEELRLCLPQVAAKKSERAPKTTPIPFEAVSETLPGLFFPPGTVLAESGEPGEQQHHFNALHYVYLRVYPLLAQPRTGLQKMVEAFKAGRLVTLSEAQYPLVRRNEFGPIGFEGASTSIRALVQGFPTGELWAVNGYVVREHFMAGRDVVIVPIIAVERAFVHALKNYVTVGAAVLGLSPPFQVIMGIAGVGKALLAGPNGEFGNAQFHGPIYDDDVRVAVTLDSTDDVAVQSAVREFSEKICDAAAVSRAEILTDEIVSAHGLPPR